MSALEQIPAEVLALLTSGVNIQPGTLGEQLGDRPTALVFLRHFG